MHEMWRAYKQCCKYVKYVTNELKTTTFSLLGIDLIASNSAFVFADKSTSQLL